MQIFLGLPVHTLLSYHAVWLQLTSSKRSTGFLSAVVCSEIAEYDPFRGVICAFRSEVIHMVSASMTAKAFNVLVEEKSGLYFGTSPEIKGLFIARHSVQEVLESVPCIVQDLFAACGEQVVISPFRQHSEAEPSWVAVPAEIARIGLERATRAS